MGDAYPVAFLFSPGLRVIKRLPGAAGL